MSEKEKAWAVVSWFFLLVVRLPPDDLRAPACRAQPRSARAARELRRALATVVCSLETAALQGSVRYAEVEATFIHGEEIRADVSGMVPP